jgi:hypothetical protein
LPFAPKLHYFWLGMDVLPYSGMIVWLILLIEISERDS